MRSRDESSQTWIVPATRAARIEERDLSVRHGQASGLEHMMTERLLISICLGRVRNFV